MATALDITSAFLDDILAKLQDTVTPPTADETSNLLNQYQTLTQLIRDGYQWSAEDLEDLPSVLRAELAIQVQVELAKLNPYQNYTVNIPMGGMVDIPLYDLLFSGIFAIRFGSEFYPYNWGACIVEIDVGGSPSYGVMSERSSGVNTFYYEGDPLIDTAFSVFVFVVGNNSLKVYNNYTSDLSITLRRLV